jgi:hypothetical protein
MKTYIGIDGGFTGAIAAIHPDDTWQFKPVVVIDTGKDRRLDILANQTFLREIAERAGGVENVVTIFEYAKKNPLFGTKGNWANAQNTEFWRVCLTLSGFPFAWVDPNTWQNEVFRGIPGTDTKARAQLFLQQRFPNVSVDEFKCRTNREGIRDAMCIALWGRSNMR